VGAPRLVKSVAADADSLRPLRPGRESTLAKGLGG